MLSYLRISIDGQASAIVTERLLGFDQTIDEERDFSITLEREVEPA